MAVMLTALWRAHKREPTEERFRAIVDAMHPHMIKIVSGVLGRYPKMIDTDDVYAGALFGLFDAVKKFKPRGGASFKTYATTRMIGAMHDEIRMMDHLPRWLRKLGGQLRRQRDMLRAVFNREPTIREISYHLGKSMRVCREAIVTYDRFNKLASIEMMAIRRSNEQESLGRDEFAQEKYLELVEKMESYLEGRELRIFQMHYIDGMRMRAVGAVLGIHESRVSQIASDIRERLGSFKAEILKG